MSKPKLYEDGWKLPMNIAQKNRNLFCHVCVMGKSTHHVPMPHDREMVKRRRVVSPQRGDVGDTEHEHERRRTSRSL